LRVLIVDDEPAARQRLALLLADLDVEVMGEAAHGLEALKLARERRPDLLLLDIAMPEVDGFDVVRHLPEPRPLVVFQTAYSEYALKAFEHEALDYVVKPVTRERLAQALDRARRRLAEQQAPALTADLLARVQAAVRNPRAPVRTRLLVREGRSHRLLSLRQILRFTAEEGLAYAHTRERRYLTDYTLQELEERTAGLFIRASRGDLVSLDAVERLVGAGDGSATLVLADGMEIRVSRRRAAEVRAALER
jgi:DNA-binding LytR/AlgR family response regulator